jgi:hypothetical protein
MNRGQSITSSKDRSKLPVWRLLLLALLLIAAKQYDDMTLVVLRVLPPHR